MATYDESKILMMLKTYSRSADLPLDATSVWESYDEASAYISQANAYGGQIITALVDNVYKAYILQPGESGYTLESIGADTSSVTQYVIVGTRPESGQEQGIIYIEDNVGYIWNGSEWVKVFEDVSSEISDYETRIGALEDAIDLKANIASPTFTGTVTIEGETAATQEWVNTLIGQLNNGVPGIVDGTDNVLPTTDYTAGSMWRVATAGTYAGQVCEVGDLIICIADYDADSASDNDFMVIQANIDGAVTGADSSVDGHIVVFNGTTGKVIADSEVSIDSLNDAIAKAHEHSNLATLETYTQTQTELLASAESTAQGLVDTLSSSVDDALALKANSEDVYTKTEIDNTVSTLETAINSKVDSDAVSSAITTALADYATTDDVSSAISSAIGDIAEGTTVKEYVDNAIGSGGTDSAEAIATAKAEAISTAAEYTDTQIESALTIVEF